MGIAMPRDATGPTRARGAYDAGMSTEGTTPQLLGREGWRWLAPCAQAAITDDGLAWRCGGGTDIWQVTGEAPSRHEAQALLLDVGSGDFVLQATLEAELVVQYDQVGLLVEASETSWLKAGIELDGEPWLSSVHTQGASDWARQRWSGLPATLRIERRGGTVDVSVLEPAGTWLRFRELHLPAAVRVGPYACAPKGPGFAARMRGATLAA